MRATLTPVTPSRIVQMNDTAASTLRRSIRSMKVKHTARVARLRPMAQALIAVVGGTGKLGAALARGWLKAGLEGVIGSRDAARAAGRAPPPAPGLGRGGEPGR